MRFRFFIPLLVFLGLAVFLGVRLLGEGSPTVRVIDRAPMVAVAALEEGGAPLTADTLAGRGGFRVVNFFASWCVPCLAEHPNLVTLAADSSLSVYGIAWRDSREAALAFLEQHGSPFQQAGFDPDSAVAAEWGVRGVPETFLVSPDGAIVFHHAGPLFAEDMARLYQAVTP